MIKAAGFSRCFYKIVHNRMFVQLNLDRLTSQPPIKYNQYVMIRH